MRRNCLMLVVFSNIPIANLRVECVGSNRRIDRRSIELGDSLDSEIPELTDAPATPSPPSTPTTTTPAPRCPSRSSSSTPPATTRTRTPRSGKAYAASSTAASPASAAAARRPSPPARPSTPHARPPRAPGQRALREGRLRHRHQEAQGVRRPHHQGPTPRSALRARRLCSPRASPTLTSRAAAAGHHVHHHAQAPPDQGPLRSQGQQDQGGGQGHGVRRLPHGHRAAREARRDHEGNAPPPRRRRARC